MISIIICSKDKELFRNVALNIANTIGVIHEIICVDNKKNKFSICEAYNIGISKSNYDIFCFCHEDIFIRTKGWGSKVIEHLKVKETGIIGLVGNNIQPRLPGAMWVQSSVNLIHMNYYQRYFDSNKVTNISLDRNYSILHRCSDYSGQKSRRVEVLDGFWFCGPRESFRDVKFDSLSFTGFHFYDIDISLQIGSSRENYVIFDIDVEHFSNGKLTIGWIEDSIKLIEKWKKRLPVHSNHFSKRELLRHEVAVFFNFCVICSRTKASNFFIRKTISHYFKLRWFLIINKFTASILLWCLSPSFAYFLFKIFVEAKSD